MKEYGEIPGGKNTLTPLLYPFRNNYPIKLWSRYRWWKNFKLRKSLPYLNQKGKWLTVIDRLGAPGDALITANVIRCIKEKYPRLKINCITPHPELIETDPDINSLNQKETFYSFDSTYWELVARKETKENIIAHNLTRLGIKKYEYRSVFYLNDSELHWGKSQLSNVAKPILAICTRSKESVKNWPIEYWTELLKSLITKFSIIQLGDKTEPEFQGVRSFAGKLSMRESAALLSQAKLFIGPDSLLMHVANGLNIKSLIIFGGSRPVECFGYANNINLTSTPECSPCWIHDSYETCPNEYHCLRSISVMNILSKISLK